MGGGAAAKKGQRREKAKMFTEEKVSGKYDGEVKPIRGDGPGQSTGEGPVPPHNRRDSHQAVAVPWGQRPLPAALNPSRGPDPSPEALSSVRRTSLSAGLPAQMECTWLAICSKEAGLTDSDVSPCPQSLLQKPQRV